MEGLRTSNLRSRYTSLKGFHRAFHHRMKVTSSLDDHVTLTDPHISSYGGATVIKFGQKVHGLQESVAQVARDVSNVITLQSREPVMEGLETSTQWMIYVHPCKHLCRHRLLVCILL